jgi:hypothetical protein
MEQAIRRNSFDWKFFPAASFHDRCAERSGLFKVVPEGLSNLFVVKKDLELDHPVCTQRKTARVEIVILKSLPLMRQIVLSPSQPWLRDPRWRE